MAKIKLGALISDISGSTGGTTFCKGKSGFIMKNKCNNNNTKNSKTSNNLSVNNYLQYIWDSLTSTQKNNWDKWVKFKNKTINSNDYKFLTGREAFIKFNFYCQVFNKSIIYNPGYFDTSASDVSFSIASLHGDMVILTNRILNSANELLLLELSRPVKNSLSHPGSRLRLLIFDSEDGQGITITTAYNNALGYCPDPGYYIYARWSIFRYLVPDILYKHTEKILLT